MSNTIKDAIVLNKADRTQICEILERRANDVATFKSDLEKSTGQKLNGFPGSVEMAMSREIKRLRRLADLVRVPAPPEEEDEEE